MKKAGLVFCVFVFLLSILGGAFRANELSTLAGALAGTVLTVHLYRRQGPDWNHRRSRLLRRLQE